MKNTLILALATALVCSVSRATTHDQAKVKNKTFKPATVGCVIDAANKEGVPASLMLAVASIEGGKNGTASRNVNGTYDIGHFQLNTSHWKRGGFFSDYDRETVRWDGCLNAQLASRLMRYHLDRKGNDFWRAAANYHSATPRHNQRYRRILQRKTLEWDRWLKTVATVCARRADKTRPCTVSYAKASRKTTRN